MVLLENEESYSLRLSVLECFTEAKKSAVSSKKSKLAKRIIYSSGIIIFFFTDSKFSSQVTHNLRWETLPPEQKLKKLPHHCHSILLFSSWEYVPRRSIKSYTKGNVMKALIGVGSCSETEDKDHVYLVLSSS